MDAARSSTSGRQFRGDSIDVKTILVRPSAQAGHRHEPSIVTAAGRHYLVLVVAAALSVESVSRRY